MTSIVAIVFGRAERTQYRLDPSSWTWRVYPIVHRRSLMVVAKPFKVTAFSMTRIEKWKILSAKLKGLSARIDERRCIQWRY